MQHLKTLLRSSHFWKKNSSFCRNLNCRSFSLITCRDSRDAHQDFSGMELTFLGTSAGGPTLLRSATSVALRNEESTWLFDCGEGAQKQILQTHSITVADIRRIFISHMHGDHIFGLPGLLCSISSVDREDSNPLAIHLYGPLGLYNYINSVVVSSQASLNKVRLFVHELVSLGVSDQMKETNYCPPHKCITRCFIEQEEDTKEWILYKGNFSSVRASSLRHTVPSLGFVIEEYARPGTLDAKQVFQRGLVRGPLIKQLKNGESVQLPDGSFLHPHEVVGPEIPGRKIVILGDTCDSSRIQRAAMNADVLVHEATMENHVYRKAIKRGHSTPKMAMDFAKKVNAGYLVLTHIGGGINPSRIPIVDELKEKTIIANDFLCISLDRFRRPTL